MPWKTRNKERQGTAIHEAGHAVIARALGIKVTSISMHNDGVSAARVKSMIPQWRPGLEAELKLTMAGAAAQGRLSTEDVHMSTVPELESDYERIIVLAANMAAVDAGLEWDDMAKLDVADLNAFIRRFSDETEALVEQHWPAIVRVAKALMVQNWVTGAELDRLMDLR
jgi:hypothetical protein